MIQSYPNPINIGLLIGYRFLWARIGSESIALPISHTTAACTYYCALARFVLPSFWRPSRKYREKSVGFAQMGDLFQRSASTTTARVAEKNEYPSHFRNALDQISCGKQTPCSQLAEQPFPVLRTVERSSAKKKRSRRPFFFKTGKFGQYRTIIRCVTEKKICS